LVETRIRPDLGPATAIGKTGGVLRRIDEAVIVTAHIDHRARAQGVGDVARNRSRIPFAAPVRDEVVRTGGVGGGNRRPEQAYAARRPEPLGRLVIHAVGEVLEWELDRQRSIVVIQEIGSDARGVW